MNKGTAHKETRAVASVLERANSCFHEGRIGTMKAYPRKSTRNAADSAQNAQRFCESFIPPHPLLEVTRLHHQAFQLHLQFLSSELGH